MNLNAIVNDPTQQTWRSFTIDEANRSLVLVKRITSDLVEAHSRMLDLHESAEAAAEADAGQVDGMYRELRGVVDKLHGYLKELEEVGVELEEMSLGIVDFPAMSGGREVRLCWQLGQETVQYWHDVGATAATRRPVESMPVPVGAGR